MDLKKTQKFVNEIWQTQIVPMLCDYIRIPNKSPMFDPDWEANGYMRQAVEMLAGWTDNINLPGLTTEIISLPGRTPVIFSEMPSTGGDGTVLLYGHYDKQPEFTGWEEGLDPWVPVIKNDRLYGRGGADDGYAWFASLTAIAALEQQNIPHGRCVLLIEGCEESGSFDLPYYADALRARIGKPDLVICLDAECGNYDQLWLTTSLRGMLPGTLNVSVLTEGQHSGAAGGIVPSSFRLLRNLLERVEDSSSGRLHECLNVDIPDHAIAQLRQVGQTLGPSVFDRFPWAGTTSPEATDVVDALVNNAWRPSLAVVGLSGAPQVGDAGNTLRPTTSARLVFRLPPTADAGQCATRIKSLLEANPPYGAQVSFDLDVAQTGWQAPPPTPWLAESANLASQGTFGKPAMYMGMGGTIPFMKMLGDAYPQVQFMVSGVLGPKSNAHGPNEFLHIPTGQKLTACVAQVLADHAKQPSSG